MQETFLAICVFNLKINFFKEKEFKPYQWYISVSLSFCLSLLCILDTLILGSMLYRHTSAWSRLPALFVKGTIFKKAEVVY